MEKLIKSVIEWGESKNITKPENASKQLLKCVEEVGEVSGAYLKGEKDNLKLEIGDVLVTLILFSKQNNLNIESCLDAAYNKIKNRKGKTVNGTFIKE